MVSFREVIGKFFRKKNQEVQKNHESLLIQNKTISLLNMVFHMEKKVVSGLVFSGISTSI